jgi:hypothetical protein
MLPPFSGVDLVRVMRAELEDERRKAKRHLPFESAEDFEDERSGSGTPERGIGGLRRLVQFAIFTPDRNQT